MTPKHTTWKWVPASADDHTNQNGTCMELIDSAYEVGDADSILYHGADWPMRQKHMALIAAAPDMLQAVEDALEVISDLRAELDRDQPPLEIERRLVQLLDRIEETK